MERNPTDKSIDDLADRVGRFEKNVDERFDKVDRRFDKVDRRFERLEDKIDARFAKLDARFDRWGRIIAGGVVSVAGAAIYKLIGL